MTAAYDTLDAAYGSAVCHLIVELRPDLPVPVVRSLAVEVVDRAHAGAAWLGRRQAVDPHVLAASRNRHTGRTYQQRRSEEIRDAAPRRGDYIGHGNRAGAE